MFVFNVTADSATIQPYDRERDRQGAARIIERPRYLIVERVMSEVTGSVFRRLRETPFLQRLFQVHGQDLATLSLRRISLICRISPDEKMRFKATLNHSIVDQTRQLMLKEENDDHPELRGIRYLVDTLEAAEGETLSEAIVSHAKARLLLFYYLGLLLFKQ